MSKSRMIKYVSIFAICTGLAACGGGGGSDGSSGSGSVDPSAYAPTTPGAGSTTTSGQTSGTIKYAQYQQTPTAMSDKTFATPAVTANVTYDATTKAGSIQFPVMGTNESITTSDAYTTTKWTGPFLTGAYKFDGNILMGCYTAAPIESQKTQIFVSSSLVRVKNSFIDDMNGKSFDLIDCTMMEQGSVGTLTLNADGTMFLSTANVTISKNQVFDMLNPESYPGALVNTSSYTTTGFYSGHAFKYGVNGVTKYAIVIQTNSNNNTNGSSYHYLLAVQR